MIPLSQTIALKRTHVFQQIAETERATRDYVGNGKEMANSVFNVLRGSGAFRIDRVLIAGSIGKGTALSDKFAPDFDLVVFINDEHPPFEEVLQKFAAILLSAGLNGYQLEAITKFSIQFNVDVEGTKVSFDLLPATNFAKGWAKSKRKNYPIKPQADFARDLIHQYYCRFGDFGYKFSSCLAEQTVLFLKQNPKWIIDTIHVAKFWDKHVHFEKKISGRSHIIELITVKACSKLQKRKTVARGFIRFLQMMTELDTQHIVFGHNYPKQVVPQEILDQVPLILDPVNPCNNLAAGLNEEIFKTYKNHAYKTLDKSNRLEYLEKPDALFY